MSSYMTVFYETHVASSSAKAATLGSSTVLSGQGSSSTKSTTSARRSPSPKDARPLENAAIVAMSGRTPSSEVTDQISQPKCDVYSTVLTYNSSSHNVTRHQGDNLDDRPRPFPTPSRPTPGQNAEPPTKLDELMASFGDAEMWHQRKQPPGFVTPDRKTSETRTTTSWESIGTGVVALRDANPPPPDDGVRRRGNSRNVVGLPVYYPPGAGVFAMHKEPEAKMENIRARGEWEKHREGGIRGNSGGVALVPVCLPVCCAMPCSIM